MGCETNGGECHPEDDGNLVELPAGMIGLMMLENKLPEDDGSQGGQRSGEESVSRGSSFRSKSRSRASEMDEPIVLAHLRRTGFAKGNHDGKESLPIAIS